MLINNHPFSTEQADRGVMEMACWFGYLAMHINLIRKATNSRRDEEPTTGLNLDDVERRQLVLVLRTNLCNKWPLGNTPWPFSGWSDSSLLYYAQEFLVRTAINNLEQWGDLVTGRPAIRKLLLVHLKDVVEWSMTDTETRWKSTEDSSPLDLLVKIDEAADGFYRACVHQADLSGNIEGVIFSAALEGVKNYWAQFFNSLYFLFTTDLPAERHMQLFRAMTVLSTAGRHVF